jgi:transcriptional regulator with XRE-family HTH domain
MAMVFKDRLKEIRELRGLTQPELAERSQMSIKTISFYENGVTSPNVAEELPRLAKALDVTPAHLAFGAPMSDAEQLILDLLKRLKDKEREQLIAFLKETVGERAAMPSSVSSSSRHSMPVDELHLTDEELDAFLLYVGSQVKTMRRELPLTIAFRKIAMTLDRDIADEESQLDQGKAAASSSTGKGIVPTTKAPSLPSPGRSAASKSSPRKVIRKK